MSSQGKTSFSSHGASGRGARVEFPLPRRWPNKSCTTFSLENVNRRVAPRLHFLISREQRQCNNSRWPLWQTFIDATLVTALPVWCTTMSCVLLGNILSWSASFQPLNSPRLLEFHRIEAIRQVFYPRPTGRQLLESNKALVTRDAAYLNRTSRKYWVARQNGASSLWTATINLF